MSTYTPWVTINLTGKPSGIAQSNVAMGFSGNFLYYPLFLSDVGAGNYSYIVKVNLTDGSYTIKNIMVPYYDMRIWGCVVYGNYVYTSYDTAYGNQPRMTYVGKYDLDLNPVSVPFSPNLGVFVYGLTTDGSYLYVTVLTDGYQNGYKVDINTGSTTQFMRNILVSYYNGVGFNQYYSKKIFTYTSNSNKLFISDPSGLINNFQYIENFYPKRSLGFGQYRTFTINGKYLYSSSSVENQISRYNVADGSLIDISFAIVTPSNILGMGVYGNYLYGSSGVNIYRIPVPNGGASIPFSFNSYSLSTFITNLGGQLATYASYMVQSGSYLYFAYNYGGNGYLVVTDTDGTFVKKKLVCSGGSILADSRGLNSMIAYNDYIYLAVEVPYPFQRIFVYNTVTESINQNYLSATFASPGNPKGIGYGLARNGSIMYTPRNDGLYYIDMSVVSPISTGNDLNLLASYPNVNNNYIFISYYNQRIYLFFISKNTFKCYDLIQSRFVESDGGFTYYSLAAPSMAIINGQLYSFSRFFNFSSNISSIMRVDSSLNYLEEIIPTEGLSRFSLANDDNNNLYMLSSQQPYVYKLNISPPPPPVCFLEGSKILCLDDDWNVEYRAIETLRPGMKVSTYKHGYVPIHTIGRSTVYNSGDNQRIKERLYILKNEQYPELFEPLIITGCHSILYDDIGQEQGEKMVEICGCAFKTDDKWRLMACLDEKAEPWSEDGTFTIWHIALEHENPYMNYGIYANGLLVESASQRFVQEKLTLVD